MEGTLRAEGDLDFRGTPGVDRDASVGFSAIRLSFDLSGSASPDEPKDLIAATKRYCVVPIPESACKDCPPEAW